MPIHTLRRDPSTPLARRSGRLGRALLVVLAAFAGLPVADAQTERRPAQSQKQKESELKRVNDRIERVRRSVNADIEKRDRLGAQLRDAELAVQAARKALDEARAQRVASEARLKELEREQARRERELGAERGALAGELRAAYVNGREEQLKLLLNQQDPA
jgi:murein hydrolase activator